MTGIIAAPRRRLVLLLLLRTLALLWIAVAVVAVLLLVADVVLILDASWRERAPWLMLGAGILAAGLGALSLGRVRAGRLAARLEASDSRLGSRLSNAVALAGAGPVSGRVGEHLRQQAISLGQETAGGARIWPLIAMSLSACALAAVSLGLWWALSPLLAGEVIGAVWPRFIDPHGDHPPYSRLRFALEPAEDQVLYGSNLEIQAQVAGGAVDRLLLFSRRDGEDTVHSTVMFRRPDGGFVQTLTNLRQPLHIWVGDGRARSVAQPITIRLTPRITLGSLRIDYPDHTGLDPLAVELGEEELRLPRRSRITWTVASNRPLSGGRLILEPLAGGPSSEVLLHPNPEQNQMVEGSMALTEAVAFSLHISDVDQLGNSSPPRGRLLIQPDRPPRLDITLPGRDAVSTPDMRIPWQISASDDYGVVAVHWLLSINDSLEDVSPIPLPSGRHRRLRLDGQFDLADLGLRPGDTIRYAAEAIDNDPDGPQMATTPSYRIEIVSEEDYRELMRRQQMHEHQQRFLDEFLTLADTARRLGERARHLAEEAAEGDAKDLAQESAALQAELERYAAELRRLAERQSRDPLLAAFDQRVRERMQELRQAQAAAAEAAQAGADRAALAEASQRMAKALGDLGEQMDEQVSEPARHADAVYQLMSASQGFTALAAQQQQIAAWSRRHLDEAGGDERQRRSHLANLATQQTRLRAALLAWQEEVRDLIDRLPADEVYDPLRIQAEEFLDAVNEAAIAAVMDAARGHFATLQGADGHRQALEAWRRMDALIVRSPPENMAGTASECLSFQPALASLPPAARQQLAGLLDGSGAMQGGPGEGTGFSMLSGSMATYGPDIAGQQARGGRGQGPGRDQAGQHVATVGDTDDPQVPRAERSGGLRLQPDLHIPLRYRRLVGAYFQAVADLPIIDQRQDHWEDLP